MQALAWKYAEERNPLKRRLLNQMGRELLLGQGSDWAFLMSTGTAVEYSTRRTQEHISNFNRLEMMLEEGIDEGFLSGLEERYSIFDGLQFEIWR